MIPDLTDTEQLLVHAGRITELDEAWRTLAAQFDDAVVVARTDHAVGRQSAAVTKSIQLSDACTAIAQLALDEIERCAATLSRLTARGR